MHVSHSQKTQQIIATAVVVVNIKLLKHSLPGKKGISSTRSFLRPQQWRWLASKNGTQ